MTILICFQILIENTVLNFCSPPSSFSTNAKLTFSNFSKLKSLTFSNVTLIGVNKIDSTNDVVTNVDKNVAFYDCDECKSDEQEKVLKCLKNSNDKIICESFLQIFLLFFVLAEMFYVN